MSDVGLPSVGLLICPCGLGRTPKFHLGGGVGPMTLSEGGDFLLPFFARAPARVSRAGASVPRLIAKPTRLPTGNPRRKPSVAPLVLVGVCPPGILAQDPTGTPTAAPLANA
jgi:hypothetical protein